MRQANIWLPDQRVGRKLEPSAIDTTKTARWIFIQIFSVCLIAQIVNEIAD